MTTTTMTDVASVAERTMLVVLTTGAWRVTRMHRDETRAENERHNTQAARVLVKVCDHGALANIGKLHAEAYRTHRELTLPSIQDGMRMLPSSRVFEHTDKMRAFAESHRKFVEAFLADYERERATAPERLGTLYDKSVWPTQDDVASRFTFKTRYLVCPSDGSWAEWIRESARAAEDDLRDRLRSCLQRVSARCGGGGPLHDSVFEAVRELVTLVPDLNLTGASDIAQTVDGMKTSLAKYDADSVRNLKSRRANAASEADRLVSILGGLK